MNKTIQIETKKLANKVKDSVYYYTKLIAYSSKNIKFKLTKK